MTDPARACARVPQCGEDYLGRISGPLMDRFDLRIEVPPVAFTDLDLPPSGDPSAIVAVRVAEARALQGQRYGTANGIATNSDIESAMLEEVATPDTEGRELLLKIAEKFGLSARGYQRVLRVARTLADLDGSVSVRRPHVAEAASYRIAFSKVS